MARILLQYFRTYKLAVHFIPWKSNFNLVIMHFKNSYNSNLYYALAHMDLFLSINNIYFL